MHQRASWLQPVEDWLRRFFVVLAVLATLSGVGIIGLVGTSVVMRHVAHAPLHFTEELVGLLMTAAFFLALPLVTLNAEHVRVQILVSAIPPRVAVWVGVAATALGVLFSLWFFWLGLPWLEFAFQRSIKTEVGRLLMYPWMALVPVSMLLTAMAFVMRAASASETGTAADPSQRADPET